MKSETWVDVFMQQVEDCILRESRLTEWEINFIDSIRSRLEAEIPLTAKQEETLDRIWNHATAKG